MIELIPNEWRYRDAETKQPTPWYVRPVVEMLYGMDMSLKSVFEYGVGDSTKWYHDRGAYVFGVDGDYEWVLKVKDYSNVRHWHQDIWYIGSIEEHKTKFDIIVIDGLYRDQCLERAIRYIEKDGMIIIDNFEQPSADLPHWPLTRKFIEENNLIMEVYKEEGHQDWKTAIIRL
jgi:hypothetical protein